MMTETPATPATPPGWYDDGSGKQRWYDGTNWTEQVQAPPRRRYSQIEMTLWTAASLIVGIILGSIFF